MPSLRRILALLMIPAAFVFLGAGCGGGETQSVDSVPRVTLKYWRVFDDEDNFGRIISAYRAAHPNVSIEYRKLRSDEYEDELVRALAEGNGPDIVSIHNTKLRQYQSLLQPMPAQITTTNYVEKGTLRKETVVEKRQIATMTVKQLRDRFVDVVSEDVVLPYRADSDLPFQDRIYGLPLAIDTMVLYYNRDMLNAAGIAQPPTDWASFQQAVEKITQVDANGNVTRSATAMGTSRNVDRSFDIVSLLMMQNGVTMNDDRGNVAFQLVPAGADRDAPPNLGALTFYTDFANPTKTTYTWNDRFPNSFDAFARGQTAFFLGYAYHMPLLAAAAPKLDYAIAPVPQIGDGRVVNAANYWVESVTKNTKRTNEAWDFLLFATNEKNVPSYLAASKKPTALRSLIAGQLADETLAPFAGQVLTAKSWYRGRDAEAAEDAFTSMIDTILIGTDRPGDVITNAARVVQQTY